MNREMTQVQDPIGLIRKLGSGTPPTSLGLTPLADGFVDLRNLSLATPPLAWAIRVGQGSITRRPTRPVFERLTLEKIDLCGSKIGESLWEDVQLRSVRFTNADLHNADFSSGIIEDVSFVDANLEGSIWGMQGLDGPRVSGVDFSGAKMFPSTYGHPLFRNCLFSRAKLDGVNFRASRFEYCVFEGILRNVQFRGCSDDPNPIVAALRNEMKGVDFSHAELHWVEFTDGIDLRTCKFPSEGYLRIPEPKGAFLRAIQLIEARRTDDLAKKAVWFLGHEAKKFPEYQPLTILNRADFIDPSADEVTREMDKLVLWALEHVANPAQS